MLFSAESYGERLWPVTNHPESEVEKLAGIWAKRDLLFLHDGFTPEEPECKTKIFNAYTSQRAWTDRSVTDVPETACNAGW